jgi:hypothetical protein
MSLMREYEYYGSMEQVWWECKVPFCASCGSTKATVARDAELMADQQGHPVPAPICCEVVIQEMQ